MRTCTRCLKPKPLDEFGVNRYYLRHGAKDGRAVTCKECNREHSAALREVYRELLSHTRAKVRYSVLGMR
jgi:hypothetical protein